jgi:hypothetical protein
MAARSLFLCLDVAFSGVIVDFACEILFVFQVKCFSCNRLSLAFGLLTEAEEELSSCLGEGILPW